MLITASLVVHVDCRICVVMLLHAGNVFFAFFFTMLRHHQLNHPTPMFFASSRVTDRRELLGDLAQHPPAEGSPAELRVGPHGSSRMALLMVVNMRLI